MAPSGSGAFLTNISDALVDLGPAGIHLTSLTLTPSHQAVLTQTDQTVHGRLPDTADVFPLAELPPGGRFASHEQRREAFWQPAPHAPAYLHLAWLLNELGEELNTLRAAGLILLRAESPEPDSVDLILVHHPLHTAAEPPANVSPEGETRCQASYQPPETGQDQRVTGTSTGTTYRVRIQLQHRGHPLEFPAMYLRELFEESRHTRWMTTSTTHSPLPLVDLRSVL
ncbi:hypothetical protein [Streptomyces sp. bgisy100]|uniref:hypothetical protein n=1 Tax=Streptomyces sp. bgisy100 TaxID=3413783 RepID=UPI003D749BC2